MRRRPRVTMPETLRCPTYFAESRSGPVRMTNVHFGVVLPEGNRVIVQPIVPPEAIHLAPGNPGGLALVTATRRDHEERPCRGGRHKCREDRPWRETARPTAGADSRGEALEQLHVEDRVSHFVGEVGGNELPRSPLRERVDQLPEEAREVVLEMAVLRGVIGELGDQYLALLPRR